MELNSRHIVALAAPVVVAYLTYTTVEKGAEVLRAATALKAQSMASQKSRQQADSGTAAVRDPFAPVSVVEIADSSEDSSATPESAAAAVVEAAVQNIEPLRLDGTVITGRWRFAILNGSRVIEGQLFRGHRFERIEPERLVLSRDGETVHVNLEIARAVAPQPLLAATRPGLPGAFAPVAVGSAPRGANAAAGTRD